MNYTHMYETFIMFLPSMNLSAVKAATAIRTFTISYESEKQNTVRPLFVPLLFLFLFPTIFSGGSWRDHDNGKGK